MIGFNPDGSLRLPGSIRRAKEENESKMAHQRCLKVQKRIVSFDSPKKCCLKFELSPFVTDRRFVNTIYDEFRLRAETPTRLNVTGDRSFEVEVFSDFRRCSDCCRLVGLYREFIQVVEDRGNCTYNDVRFME